MGWEVIAGVAEWTYPEFGPEVDLTVGIQDSVTGYGRTTDWFVGKGSWWCRGLGELGEGSVEGSDGCDNASSFESGAGPSVEGEAGAVSCFHGSYIPSLFLHCD